jgi:4-amino-4-deoxy-L-arabinose transferase-like glycosyltransferase
VNWRALIALQLTAIVVFGAITALKFPFLSPIDEAAHLDYVRVIAEDHRLPVLGEDRMGYPVLALNAQQDPNASPPPKVERPPGLPGQSYEAFEPPLYYLLAAPTFVVTDDWGHRVKLVRLLDLGFLLAAAAVLYLLAGRALGEARLIGFSAALAVLMWPGVVVRSITVSNAALELLLASAFLYASWRADEDRDGRALLGAGVVLGLGLLTKLTLVVLVPLLAVVAVRHARATASWRTALGALAVPLLLLAPWLIFNIDHYSALTANGLARDMQQPVVNPNDVTFTIGRFFDRAPQLLTGQLPQEWDLVVAPAPLLGFGFDFIKVAALSLPALLLIVEPQRLRTREAGLLVAPFALGFAFVAYATLIENWPITEARRLYPMWPALALFGAIGWLALLRSRRAAAALAVGSAGTLALAWVDLTSRFLL